VRVHAGDDLAARLLDRLVECRRDGALYIFDHPKIKFWMCVLESRDTFPRPVGGHAIRDHHFQLVKWVSLTGDRRKQFTDRFLFVITGNDD